MAKFLSNISLEQANDIQFKTAAGANAGKIEQDGNDLVLTNAVGDVLLGDGDADVYIGDGTNNVDILFEQSGNIKADDSASSVTLTIGSSNTTLNLISPNVNGSISLGVTGVSNVLTLTSSSSKIVFDYEAAQTGEYTNEVPLLQIDRSGSPITILSRVSSSGAVVLGADDMVHIAAGDTKTVVKANRNMAEEQVVFSSEAGFIAYGFPDNGVTWANRNEFKFRSDSATASQNGLYIGDGGNTQFIDLSRNLTVGTIGSGAITSTGKITGTELEGTSLDINGNADISGTLNVHQGVEIADVIDGEFTALRLMNQKTYGSGTGTNEKVRFVMGISESGHAFSTREGFAIDLGISAESDSSDGIVLFKVRDGGTLGTYQTVNGSDKSVAFAGNVTAGSNSLTAGSLDINGAADISGILSAGQINMDGALNATSTGQFHSTLYIRSSIQTMNKAANAFLNFAARDTTGSETVMNLSNIGTLTAAGEIEGGSLDINGNADISGALTLGTALAIAEGGTGATASTGWLNSNSFANFLSTSADWDTITTRGSYRLTGNTNNIFGAGSHATGIVVIQDDNNYGFQLFAKGSSDNQEHLAYRYRTTSWSSTQIILTKTLGDGRYATTAQGTLATNALPKAGGTMSGAIAMGSQNITGAGTITGTTLTGTSLDINGAADISGNLFTGGKVLVNQGSDLTTQAFQVNGFIDITDVTGTALRWYNGSTFRGGLGLDSWAHSGSSNDITMYISGDNSFHVSTNNVKRAEFNATGLNVVGELEADSLDIDGNADISGTLTVGSSAQHHVSQYTAPDNQVSFNRTSSSDQWFRIITSTSAQKRIKLSVSSNGDNTNTQDQYFIAQSGYSMQSHIFRLPGTKYNTSKLISVMSLNPSGSTQDVWIKLLGMSSGTGTTVISANVPISSSSVILGTATTTKPTLQTGDTELEISVADRNAFTTMSSRGGKFGGDVTVAGEVEAASLDISGDADIDGTLNADGLDIDGNADISGNLAVDGIANLDNTDIDGTFNATGTTFDVNSSTSLTLDNTNTTNGVKINTATSGSPVTIGHATSEVLIADNLTINGNLTTKGDVIIENTTNLAIRDTIITLNDGTSGTSGTDSSDIGIMMERHGTNKFFGYDASENEFIMVESTADVSGAVSGVQMGTTQTLAANIRAYDSIKIGETANDAVSVFPASTTTSLGTSNTLVPTQNAVKSYVDAKTWNWNDITAGTVPSTILNSNVTSVSGNAGTVTNGVYTTGDQNIAGKKTFTNPTKLEQTWFYDMSAGSLDTTGYACAGLSAGNNGSSATFVFECGGGAGSTYQKIVYNCWNVSGTWNTSKDVDEGANDFDVTVSSNASTITFTFKTRSGSQNYTPRVHVQAMGSYIVTTY